MFFIFIRRNLFATPRWDAVQNKKINKIILSSLTFHYLCIIYISIEHEFYLHHIISFIRRSRWILVVRFL